MARMSFHTRLRGSQVRCYVSPDGHIHVDVLAASMKDGLERVSRFAGYCSRSLELSALADDDVVWACAVADYYGFGLIRILGDERAELVSPRAFTPSSMTEARAQFRRLVLSSVEGSATSANVSAQTATS